MKDFVYLLNSFDSALGEFAQPNSLKSDVFSSSKIKEMYSKKDSMNDFIETHCFKSAYVFQVKAVCWMTTAKVEMEAGRDPNIYPGDTHPTCPFGCLRPYQPLSEFALTTYLPCPDKDICNKGADAPFLSYQCAKARIIQGKKNAGDTFVPSLTIAEVKSKCAVPPINTRGDYFFIIVTFYLSLFQTLFSFFMHFIFFHAQFFTVTLYVSLI